MVEFSYRQLGDFIDRDPILSDLFIKVIVACGGREQDIDLYKTKNTSTDLQEAFSDVATKLCVAKILSNVTNEIINSPDRTIAAAIHNSLSKQLIYAATQGLFSPDPY